MDAITPNSTPLRFRFSLRTMFVMVTVMAVATTGWKVMKRGAALRTYAGMLRTIAENNQSYDPETSAYCTRMAEKYERAAWYPWSSIEPDEQPPPAKPILPR